MRIVFQGDSITDAGRDRGDICHLGSGYAAKAATLLRQRLPTQELVFFNTGVSGNRCCDMKARWQADCIDLRPDMVSVLIGINDTWRAMDSGLVMPAAEFEGHYREILERVRRETEARILLLEPFLLHVRPEQDDWRADLNPKIDAVRRLARQYADAFIPLDGLFAAACVGTPATDWSEDGVHLSDKGAAFTAVHYADAAAALLGGVIRKEMQI